MGPTPELHQESRHIQYYLLVKAANEEAARDVAESAVSTAGVDPVPVVSAVTPHEGGNDLWKAVCISEREIDDHLSRVEESQVSRDGARLMFYQIGRAQV